MALAPCKYRHLVGETDKGPMWHCDLVKAMLTWDCGFQGPYCEHCTERYPVEVDRQQSDVVKGIAAAGASVAIASGPEWRKRMLADCPLSVEDIFAVITDTQERQFIIDTLEAAVLSGGEKPEVAAALMESYLSKVTQGA